MTKLYRFTQTLNNHTEPYYQMEGTLEDIMAKWWRNIMSNALYRYIDSSFNTHQRRVEDTLNKQSFYIEIVDDSVYGLGWTTKIEEVN